MQFHRHDGHFRSGTIFIPILIAAHIVLNTMMGAVYERNREIGIYTALGIAPEHIGALFLAESSDYAVLGAVVGYMLGQFVAMLQVNYLLIEGLNLNYSSVAAVFTVQVHDVFHDVGIDDPDDRKGHP